MNTESLALQRRAAVHAALGEPVRLAIADALVLGDASPGEIGESLGLRSNLLAHHLRVLEAAGVINRARSQADRRRAYIRLLPGAAALLAPPAPLPVPRVVFVCTSNSVRSQLAAAVWAARSRVPSASAGTHPASCVHRRAIGTARRHGLSLDPRGTAHVRDVLRPGDLVVAVCDSAHEELGRLPERLHWSVPDPVPAGTDAAFDQALAEIQTRIERLTAAVGAGRPAAEDTMTETYHHPDITLDQRYALLTAARNLADEFSGVLNTETIDRFLHSSYDELAPAATIQNFLPMLAERFARQRLRALVRIEGKEPHDGTPIALFLCVRNAGRSQMALGFFQRLAGDRAIGWSGGSEPGSQVNPAAVEAMKERGIDISDEFPKPWTDEVVRAADVVITMGCGDACPIFPGKRYEDWPLEDPEGQDMPAVRAIRDQIEERVRRLLDEIGVPAAR